MNYSLESYLQIINPYINSQLVSPQFLSRILSLSKDLPAFTYSGFESHLGSKQSQVDFFVRYFSNTALQNLSSYSQWEPLKNFAQEWAKIESPLHQKITDIWLEFDVDEPSLQTSIPGIFLTLNKHIVEEIPELTQQALKLLNRPIPSKLESNLKLCVDCLPPEASFLHIGIMLSRPHQAIRLDVAGLAFDQLLDYLKEIGWIEQTNRLRSLITDLSNFVDHIHLAFDVGDTIFPRIGLECFLKQQPKYEPRWQLFLDYLVEQELCTQAEQKALLCWPGFSQIKSNPVNGGDYLFSNKGINILGRSISHIKIVEQPNLPLEAKAYLAIAQRWFDMDISSKEQVN